MKTQYKTFFMFPLLFKKNSCIFAVIKDRSFPRLHQRPPLFIIHDNLLRSPVEILNKHLFLKKSTEQFSTIFIR